MIKRVIGTFCVTVLTFVVCTNQPTGLAGGASDTEVSACVSGIVSNLEGAPATGAAVLLRSSDYLTPVSTDSGGQGAVSQDGVVDDSGRFSIDSVPAGSYNIEVTKSDSIGALLHCSVFPGNRLVMLDSDTLKPYANISGHVFTDSKSVTPVVQIYGMERLIKPDSTGFFSVMLPEGSYSLKLSGPAGYDQLEIGISVDAFDHKYLGTFYLYPDMTPPCTDYSCDSAVVQEVLNNCNKSDISVDSVTVIRNGRIVELHLRGFGQNVTATSIGRLNFLEVLDLGGNDLQSLPQYLGLLWLLRELRLDGNQLTTVPDNIGFLIHLGVLDLSDNNLVTLPDGITQLNPVISLGLSNNELCSLPVHLKVWADRYDPDWSSSQVCDTVQ